MRCTLCDKWVKHPHNSVRRTADKLCQTCLVITERMIFFGHFALVADVIERKQDNSTFNKNQHWICVCGQKNHFNRSKCLRCGDYP